MTNFLQVLLAAAPPGESPYAYVAARVSQTLPDNPGWFFWMLAAGSLVSAVNLGVNLVCVCMIGARRKLGETSPYWVVRLRYDHSSGVPYLVPNAIMSFLIFNGIFALLMQPYVWINYVAYMDQTHAAGLRSGLFFWYGFIFIFDGSGMWMSAFGTFYATLLPQLLISNKINNSRFFVHPVFLNTLCYGFPAVLFVTQVVTSALLQIAWVKQTLTTLTITSNLRTLDCQWSVNKTIDSVLLNDTLALADPLMHQLIDARDAFVRNAITCGAWYFLCFLFFTPSAIWLLYVLRRIITHKLQFVTRMPTSGVDIQLPVSMERFGESSSRVEMGEHGDHEYWESPPPVALHLPHSYTSLTGGDGSNREASSGGTTPTSTGLSVRAAGVGQQPVVISPTTLEHGERDLAHGELGHPHRPHDPGGPWELNVTSTAKTTKKLQTAYYSAMLQFVTTGFCLAVVSGSWIWAAVDLRVTIDLNVHAAAIMMTVWIYPLIGIAVNVFICIRLRAIGFSSNAPRPKSKLMSYLQEVWTSSSRSAQGTGRS